MSEPFSSCPQPASFTGLPTASGFQCAGRNLPLVAHRHKTWEVLPTNVGKIARAVLLPLRARGTLSPRRCLGDALVGMCHRLQVFPRSFLSCFLGAVYQSGLAIAQSPSGYSQVNVQECGSFGFSFRELHHSPCKLTLFKKQQSPSFPQQWRPVAMWERHRNQ